ncbi:leukocyte elastase inhibitor-like [Limulus polyphemus]|uniref:Leukocyte elastase inhibitor-like n=1 Tax=Limulus polyphemus TaxID=6850 RepID=A0ABM1BTG1_LIMPO|nr:leukocyte elastase inhibitor-like [Limulus polyphemus]
MRNEEIQNNPAGRKYEEKEYIIQDNSAGRKYEEREYIIQDNSADNSRMGYIGVLWKLVILLALTTSVFSLSYGIRKVAFATNQFGMDLYRAMNQESNNTNVAISPLSISTALAAMMIGSRGDSTAALRHALYLWGMYPQEIHGAFYDLLHHLSTNLQASAAHRHNNESVTNESVNNLLLYSSMYVQRDFSVRFPFQMFLLGYYNTTVHPVDFYDNGEETRNHINAVVSKETAGKIKDILPELPARSTTMLLLNGIHFRGLLDMNVSVVEEGTKEVVNGAVVLEAKKARLRYGEDKYLNCTAVEVPFKNDFMSMVFLLPNHPEDVALIERRLSAQRLSDVIFNMEVKRVNIQIPRITLEETYQNLSHALSSMGLANIFTPGYAGLFGISDSRWLHLSDIVHKINIEIKEAKIETAPETSGDNAAIDVKLDRPFVYFVIDNISGLIITLGKFYNQ